MQSTYSAGCFGKLPFTGDFVRYKASGSEFQVLDQWVQEGLFFSEKFFLAEWDTIYKNSSSYNFIFSPESNNRFVVGNFFPSWDRIGRKFPFFVILSVERKSISNDHVAYIPCLFSSFFEKAFMIGNMAVKNKLSSSIYDEMDQIMVNLDYSIGNLVNSYQQFKKLTTVNDFFVRFNNHAVQINRNKLLQNLIGLIKSFNDFDVKQLDYGLKLPLTTDLNENINIVTFWMEFLLILLSYHSDIPYVFFPNSFKYEPYYMFIFFSQPSAKSFPNLVHLNLESDYVFSPELADMNYLLDEKIQILLDKKEINLNEFLNNLMRL